MFTPRHGPGATADGISGNQKFLWQRWHDRLEPFFPLLGNAYSLGAYDSEVLEKLTIVPEDQEQPVKVVTVPKTHKGPRVIAIEPCCMQFVQQGIRDALYRVIESDWIVGGHINFRDQSINQSLAMTSSRSGAFATIDLSDASDRVPLHLALGMFDSNPDLRDAIAACRSTNAKLPDGQIIGPLRKFASMGSALCFPVEAMYFYTICVKALLDSNELPYTRRNIKTVSAGVFVYGDDIIVPTEHAGTVLDYLRLYNCKVNTNKTFLTGKFRESCGVDAYDGNEITPIYVNTLQPKNRKHVSELISWTATANLFYRKGMWETARFMFSKVERILGPLPYVSEFSPALGITSFLGYRSAERWNDNTHSLEFKGWVPSSVHRTDELEGYPALAKCLNNISGNALPTGVESVDKKHLLRSSLHGAVSLKRRWVQTYI